MTERDAAIVQRKNILEALGSYQKRGRIGQDVKKMSDMLVDESDRGVVVILGSLIEDILLERLMRSFVDLEPPQKKNLTRGGGLLSSFDSRITLGQALGLLDDDLAGMLHTMKAMRNACAHSRLDIGFSTPVLRDALSLLFDGENAAAIREGQSPVALRMMFIVAYVFVSAVLRGHSPEEASAKGQRIMDEALIQAGVALVKHRASLEKRRERRATRPPQPPKG